MEPTLPRALAGPLALACACLAGCGGRPQPVSSVVDEVEAEIAELVARPDGFLCRTQEELVAGLRQRLASYGTILDGIERLRDGRSDPDLRARLGRLAQDVLALETTLDPSWRAEREPVVEESVRLERDLVRAWDEARGRVARGASRGSLHPNHDPTPDIPEATMTSRQPANTLPALFLLAGGALAYPGDEPRRTHDDLAVTYTIDRELMLDRAISAHRIDVTTDHGVVTLDGSVDNLLAKERAARLAETVKGVRSVVNRIEVTPSVSHTDAELDRDVEQALLMDPATDAYELDVVVHDGSVVLNGEVDSWAEKDLAATVSKGVAGVTGVTNQIAVRYDADRPDSELESEIERALRWNALVDDALIEVRVEDGQATLSGTVGSAAEKSHAIRSAWTAGVREVDASALTAERWARDPDLRQDKYVVESDSAVREAVREALVQDPRVLAANVAPTVSRGAVALRGVVVSLDAKRAAGEDARNTVGAHVVHNFLKVRPKKERDNDAIQADVLSAFRRDPYVNRHDVETTVDAGQVFLNGTVGSNFERQRADELASRIDGVTDVINGLRVARPGPPPASPYVHGRRGYVFGWWDYLPLYAIDDDLVLEQDVEDQFFWSPFVDGDEVEVEVEDGVVTLNGTVDSWMERGAARDNAYHAGARRVRNELRVKGSEASATQARQ